MNQERKKMKRNKTEKKLQLMTEKKLEYSFCCCYSSSRWSCVVNNIVNIIIPHQQQQQQKTRNEKHYCMRNTNNIIIVIMIIILILFFSAHIQISIFHNNSKYNGRIPTKFINSDIFQDFFYFSFCSFSFLVSF